MNTINYFNSYYRKKYGHRVDKIALTLNYECPNRKKGGCIYCLPESFTPYYLSSNKTITEQINEGLLFLKKRKSKYFFAYFQQETPTSVSWEILYNAISDSIKFENCVGVIISTRPDYIFEGTIEVFKKVHKKYPKKEILIELGLQSAKEESLKLLNRNHTFDDFKKATELILNNKFIELGVHLILGIPGENFYDYVNSINKVIRCNINYIKLHHLQLMKNTQLEKIYNKNKFELFTLEKYIETLSKIIPIIPKEIIIHRLWSNCPSDYLIGPIWRKRSYEINDLLLNTLKTKNIFQGSEYERNINNEYTKNSS